MVTALSATGACAHPVRPTPSRSGLRPHATRACGAGLFPPPLPSLPSSLLPSFSLSLPPPSPLLSSPVAWPAATRARCRGCGLVVNETKTERARGCRGFWAPPLFPPPSPTPHIPPFSSRAPCAPRCRASRDFKLAGTYTVWEPTLTPRRSRWGLGFGTTSGSRLI